MISSERENMKNSSKYLLISFATFICGYVFLRLAYYESVKIPFVQEVVLIVLGTIATVAITAALISKQSEIELEKEQRVKIFDLKSELYLELINHIELVIGKGKLDKKDRLHLEFLTHKISVVADKDVLKEYSSFIDTLNKISCDTVITAFESDEISLKLAKVCVRIRYDLIHQENNISHVEELLTRNIVKF